MKNSTQQKQKNNKLTTHSRDLKIEWKCQIANTTKNNNHGFYHNFNATVSISALIRTNPLAVLPY
jgi:hypothetical protein